MEDRRTAATAATAPMMKRFYEKQSINLIAKEGRRERYGLTVAASSWTLANASSAEISLSGVGWWL